MDSTGSEQFHLALGLISLQVNLSIIFLINRLVKCQKIEINLHYSSPKPKGDDLLFPTNGPKLKDIQFAII